jgi:hypothetical protein
MTLDELDIAVLGELGETQSDASFDSATIRYRILNRAYRHVCRKSWITWRGGATWTIAVDDETFDLEDSDVLNPTNDVLDIVRCYYLVSGLTSLDLKPATYAEILALRSIIASTSSYPRRYAFHRKWDSTAEKMDATLDIYPACRDAGDDILYVDWLEDPPALTASQDLITAAYADDCITLWGAAFMARAMPSVLYGELMQKAKEELKDIRAQSHKEASGRTESKIAK